MNINTAVMEIRSNFIGSIIKVEKQVSDGKNVFEMALHDIGYYKLYTELEEEGIDEEVKDAVMEIVKDDLFELYELDCGGVE